MGGVITYYFAPISGYAYLGHQTLTTLARQHGATVDFRPLMIAKVFAASETTPPFAQSAPRKSYRIEDQARWAAHKGLDMTPTPAHWPTDPGPACRAIIAAGKLGLDQDALSFGCLRAVWAEDRDIAQTETLADILTAAGCDAAAVLALAATDDIAGEVQKITEDAIAAEVFGSPTYVFDGQRFWGQDRLDFLASVLQQEAAVCS
ncbi:2-hydroxychromene-2-carboxylate isomerase [Aliishimia ponticola]|uniref:2-hydroxychromene-2-carboxylate isomerase n=1 Tax=Aliishimia ponticola TaxID=2499833 RepID=A0A4S4NDE6_9RHOB|nr:2-hydroxychromene-2-carboxylate isomerase [Aliishimia ponticola]THH36061.1 2-hydroxychromene-2-carboxylate isomerase [Aliishimia ponticola]